MYQYDDPTCSSTLPTPAAPGTPGYFTDGSVSPPVARTVLRSDFMNAVMLELLNLVKAAGITPLKTAYDQVLQAVKTFGFSTADMKMSFNPVTPDGWVRANDGTIGSASSGATARANADTQALYVLLWNNYSNAVCPVTGGRGASAAADFVANKPLQLVALAGRVLGNAGAGAGLTARSAGTTLGEERHTMTLSELVPHVHTLPSRNSGNTGNNWIEDADNNGDFRDANTGESGSGTPFNIMQPTTFAYLFIKL